MSILRTLVVVPSRIAGVFRYLLISEGNRENRDVLEKILAPKLILPTPASGDMVKDVISECCKMGLTTEIVKKETREICLSKTTRQLYPGSIFDAIKFRMLVNELIMDKNNKENHDMCKLLAWFLTQDVGTMNGSYEGLSQALRNQIDEGRLGLTNKSRYDNFRFWSVFLGFASVFRNLKAGTEQLIPNPTNFLERKLPEVFGHNQNREMALPDLMHIISETCPILDDGIFQKEITQSLPTREPERISSAMSLALLSLRDKKIISLETRADAPGLVVMENVTSLRITHIIYNQI